MGTSSGRSSNDTWCVHCQRPFGTYNDVNNAVASKFLAASFFRRSKTTRKLMSACCGDVETSGELSVVVGVGFTHRALYGANKTRKNSEFCRDSSRKGEVILDRQLQGQY